MISIGNWDIMSNVSSITVMNQSERCLKLENPAVMQNSTSTSSAIYFEVNSDNTSVDVKLDLSKLTNKLENNTIDAFELFVRGVSQSTTWNKNKELFPEEVDVTVTDDGYTFTIKQSQYQDLILYNPEEIDVFIAAMLITTSYVPNKLYSFNKDSEDVINLGSFTVSENQSLTLQFSERGGGSSLSSSIGNFTSSDSFGPSITASLSST